MSKVIHILLSMLLLVGPVPAFGQHWASRKAGERLAAAKAAKAAETESAEKPDEVAPPLPSNPATIAEVRETIRAKSSEGSVHFSFDQVEVRTFVKLVGEITSKKLVVDADVDGTITVVSPKIPVKEVFPVFASILESVGCSVVEDEREVYRVVKISSHPSAPVIGPDEDLPAQGIVTKVIRLSYVKASELKKVLEGKVRGSKEGALGAIETTNHLIITDTAENIRRIEKIVSEVDKPGMTRITEIVPVVNASAEDMAQQLTQAMTGQSPWQRGGRRYSSSSSKTKGGASDVPATIVAAPHSNSLLLVGTLSQIEELKRIIGLMDTESENGRGRLNAIFLNYIEAEDAALSLNALLRGSTMDSKGNRRVQPRNVYQNVGNKIAIEPHEANNALLVDAVPRDYEWIKELVAELDRPREQVLIEVVIAEVTMSDGLDWGVDMAYVELPTKVGSTVIQAGSSLGDGANELMGSIQSGLFPAGLALGLAHGVSEDANGNITTDSPGAINLKAAIHNGTFNILSHIPLLAQNNKEASVSIVENIPMLKSTVSGGSGSARDVIQNIDRVDVGIKLKLTPHINPEGEVVMDLNPSIEAVLSPGSIENGLAPTIAKREISTTVTVPNNDTVVLSGLIREDKVEAEKKIPILGHIPLIGWLFRRTVKTTKKTNLIVLVTPRIVTGRDAAKAATKDWADRTAIEGAVPKMAQP